MNSLFFDPRDPALKEKFAALQPQPGYCIVADIVDSTNSKDDGLSRWAPVFFNTFGNVRAFLPPAAKPIKCLGDALMFFIPDASCGALQIYDALASAAQEEESVYKPLKIAVAYCSDAYPLTFVEGVEDYYGKDIDLTFRLLSLAHPREILMNEPFVKRVRAEYDQIGNPEAFGEVPQIVGPWPARLKGFQAPIPIYKLPAP